MNESSSALHVVFGTGAVGSALIAELVSRGARVRAVNRSGSAQLPEGVELLSGNAADSGFAKTACEGGAVIYFCLNAPYTKWATDFPPLQAGVLAGAEAAGARLVALENVYMYGPTSGRTMTEDLPYAATTRKGRVRAAMSDQLLEAHREGRVEVAIGRASDFFGPGVRESAVGERVFATAVAGKKVQLIGDPEALHSYTYVPDIARGLAILGTAKGATGRAWHLPSAPAVTNRKFVEMVFAAAGQPVRIQRVSKPLLRLAGVFSPTIREVSEMLYEFEERFVLDDTAFTSTFNQASTPLEEAIHTTTAWFKEQR